MKKKAHEINKGIGVHASTEDHTWETPIDLFNRLNDRFNFTLDPCCSVETAKCEKFFTENENGLIQDWSKDICFVNPPYGRQIGKLVQKSYEESLRGATVVMLIPSRTDTSYWHDFIFNKATEIIFVKGRIQFGDSGDNAPFPSAVIVFDNKEDKQMFSSIIAKEMVSEKGLFDD